MHRMWITKIKLKIVKDSDIHAASTLNGYISATLKLCWKNHQLPLMYFNMYLHWKWKDCLKDLDKKNKKKGKANSNSVHILCFFIAIQIRGGNVWSSLERSMRSSNSSESKMCVTSKLLSQFFSLFTFIDNQKYQPKVKLGKVLDKLKRGDVMHRQNLINWQVGCKQTKTDMQLCCWQMFRFLLSVLIIWIFKWSLLIVASFSWRKILTFFLESFLNISCWA